MRAELIEVEYDGFGADANGDGIDKLTVKIPVGDEARLFCRLVAQPL